MKINILIIKFTKITEFSGNLYLIWAPWHEEIISKLVWLTIN